MITATIFNVSGEPLYLFESPEWDEVSRWLTFQIPQIDPKQGQHAYEIAGVYRVTVDIDTPGVPLDSKFELPDVAALNADQAIAAIKKVSDKDALELLLDVEQAGKKRVTVLDAIHEQLESI